MPSRYYITFFKTEDLEEENLQKRYASSTMKINRKRGDATRYDLQNILP